MDHTPDAQHPDMLRRALTFAAAGIPVFPCLPGGKPPLTANGFHDATIDTDQIRDWWTARPTANIATPTGAPNFDVLDVDVRPDGTGWPAFDQAKHAGLIDGWIRAVRTPSGGLHLHYPGTTQRNGSLRGLHLDFRGVGGYVLLPPSLGQTKTYSRRYDVIREQPGPGNPVDWTAIGRLLTPTPTRRPAPFDGRPDGIDPTAWLAAHVARQTEGNRDNALFWAACRAAEAGVADLSPLVDAAVSAGLSERQAGRTARSALDTITRTGTRRSRSSAPAPAPQTLSR